MPIEAITAKILAHLNDQSDQSQQARLAYYDRLRDLIAKSAGTDEIQAKENRRLLEQAIRLAEMEFVSLQQANELSSPKPFSREADKPEAADLPEKQESGDPLKASKSIKKQTSYWWAIIANFGVLAGAIDFLEPIISLKTPAIAISGAIVVATLLGSQFFPAFAAGFGRMRTIGMAGVVTVAGLFGVQSLFADGAPNGAIAEVFPPITQLQMSLDKVVASVAGIREDTQTLVEQSQKILESSQTVEENTGRISEGVDSISTQIGDVKKETSDDPRKELANQGISWDYDSFMQAVAQRDLRTIELFLKGGWVLSDFFLHEFEYQFSSPVADLLINHKGNVQPEGCNIGYHGVPDDVQYRKFIVGMCGRQNYISYLEENIRKYSLASDENERRESAIDICQSEIENIFRGKVDVNASYIGNGPIFREAEKAAVEKSGQMFASDAPENAGNWETSDRVGWQYDISNAEAYSVPQLSLLRVHVRVGCAEGYPPIEDKNLDELYRRKLILVQDL